MLSKKIIFDKSIEIENANKINLDLNIINSKNSVIFREFFSIQQNLQSILLIRYIKNIVSSR